MSRDVNLNERPGDGADHARFMRLFMAHERRIRAYVRVLVPDRELAEDVFQEASLTMLEKFAELPESADFAAWGCRIACFKVMEFRQRDRRSRLLFSEPTMQRIADEAASSAQRLDRRRVALRQCLDALDPPSRQLVSERYEANRRPAELAALTGRSIDAVYKTLSRLRDTLQRCIDRQLRLEDGESS